jgi:hypothetical protein
LKSFDDVHEHVSFIYPSFILQPPTVQKTHPLPGTAHLLQLKPKILQLRDFRRLSALKALNCLRKEAANGVNIEKQKNMFKLVHHQPKKVP